jgi:hypothetical protein
MPKKKKKKKNFAKIFEGEGESGFNTKPKNKALECKEKNGIKCMTLVSTLETHKSNKCPAKGAPHSRLYKI